MTLWQHFPTVGRTLSDSPILYHVADGVARITLNRPGVLNALNTELVVTLAERAEAAAADPSVYAVVVSGAGRAFCSGMDRDALASERIDEAFYRAWIRGLNYLEDMRPVTIAVLHGYSIGGGLQLACACDLRVATSDAVVGLGASRHGLIPDGSVLRLARLIGLARAKELSLLNDEMSADEARALGLLARVAPPAAIGATVDALLERLRHQSPTANAHIKRLLHRSFHDDPRALIETVLDAQRDCMRSWETAEANRAWRDRRDAVYYPRPPR